mgnify:CR=1 FL=1
MNILKDILFITHFTQVPGEPGNSRFHYIAERINKENANIEVITTSFSHKTKSQRNITDEQKNSLSYKLTLLYEPGYFNNVSVKRLYSHYIMGKSLKEYLNNRKKPDVIYCSVPSLSVAKVAANYAKKNNIKFIIDIQDLWPEAFKMVFNIPIISDMIFYPMRKKADFIYSAADEIIAVSQTYAERALKVNRKCKRAYVVFLGTELVYFDQLVEENKIKNKPQNEIWLAYVGTLGYSYDLICVIDALGLLKDKYNIKFIVMGDGPLRTKFEGYAKKRDINAYFTGRLDYGKMAGLLSACDIAVNPISSGAAQSIINKHADYAAAGLPVLNTQECPEYRNLLSEYKAGLNCDNNNPVDLAKKITQLCEDADLRNVMGQNSRRLAVERFDRKLTYQLITKKILNKD